MTRSPSRVVNLA